jgi:hypothetical protein
MCLSIEQPNVVDFVGVDKVSGAVVLTISDHLDWADDDAHVFKLQDKLNTCIRFIESGEFYDSYPDAKGRRAIIELVCRCPISTAGGAFLESVRSVLAGTEIELKVRHKDSLVPGNA